MIDIVILLELTGFSLIGFAVVFGYWMKKRIDKQLEELK